MWTLVTSAFLAGGASAKDDSDFGGFGAGTEDVVKLSTAWYRTAIAPGGEATLAIVAEMAPHYHINADLAQERPTGDFDPWETQIRVVEADPALTIESVRFPKAHPVTADYVDGEIYSFSGRTVFYIPMRLEEGYRGAGPVRLSLEFEFQACNDEICLPPETRTLHVELPVASGEAAVEKQNADLFTGLAATAGASGGSGGVAFDLFGLHFSVDASSGGGLALLLLVAMIGGALLNFTPCVLPVIPIKIMGLSNASSSRGQMLALGTAMSLGVVAFWLGLGLLIAGVSGFTATNQLFQYPLFTIAVGGVIAVMAVGMSGLFFIQLPQFVYAFNPSQESYSGSFGFGIMTAILSTPCTAPFMGAAAAWAATQSPVTTLATFAAIGLGMAVPYFLLSASPGLVKKMPKTGPASELIKQVMGLLMLAAAAYFIGVGVSAMASSPPDPPSRLYWWGVMAFLAAAGGWLIFKTLRITRRAVPRAVFVGLGALLVASAALGGDRLTGSGPIGWIYYTPERFGEALDQGKVVVMDFTAEWCLNCKSLEHSVLSSDRVTEALAAEDVAPIKVDITGNNPQGKAKLKDVGRLTIPLLVVVAPDGHEVFKSDFYTVDQVLDAVRRARERSGN